ncbi:MAG TPA: hypothetical protein PK150_07225 [Anaerolineaceae bacterium]|jgi:hypothetical protein|nr:hypothetical protein [Anaerolineaceae bacterium]HQJ03671.1 hypothetical protein [Anaerolineaceae bacterium]
MTITISNDSASVFARGYAHTENGLIVWLEIAPQHPKLTGAIWASLVSGHHPYLQLKDGDKGLGKAVYGLGRAYTRLEADAPTLAVANDGGKATAARAKLTRLVAPEAIKPILLDQPFYVLAWPGLTPETVLAATLEKAAPYPIRIEWGQYLLETALERGNAIPLVTGGAALPGYEIEANANWLDIISLGLKTGKIAMQ